MSVAKLSVNIKVYLHKVFFFFLNIFYYASVYLKNIFPMSYYLTKKQKSSIYRIVISGKGGTIYGLLSSHDIFPTSQQLDNTPSQKIKRAWVCKIHLLWNRAHLAYNRLVNQPYIYIHISIYIFFFLQEKHTLLLFPLISSAILTIRSSQNLRVYIYTQ